MKGINDKVDYKENCDAMNSIGFTPDERSSIWKLVAAIIHLVMLNSCAFVQCAYDWHNLIMQIFCCDYLDVSVLLSSSVTANIILLRSHLCT